MELFRSIFVKNRMDAGDGIPLDPPSPRDPYPRFLLVVAYLRRYNKQLCHDDEGDITFITRGVY